EVTLAPRLKRGAISLFGPSSRAPNEFTFDFGWLKNLFNPKLKNGTIIDRRFNLIDDFLKIHPHSEAGLYESWDWAAVSFARKKPYFAAGIARAGGVFAGADFEHGHLTGLLFGYGTNPDSGFFGIQGTSWLAEGPFYLSQNEMMLYAGAGEA